MRSGIFTRPSSIIVPKYYNDISLEKVLSDSSGLKNREKPIKLFDERRTGKRKTTGLEIKLLCKDNAHLYDGKLEKLGSNTVVVEVPDAFDAVISDMTMPQLTGDRLTFEILKIRPDLPVIICTGYSSWIDNETIKKIGALVVKRVDLLRRHLYITPAWRSTLPP